MDPKNHLTLDAALNRAQTLLQSGQSADAALLCRRILEVNQNPSAHGLLAMALANQGQFEDAIANAETALRLDPECYPALNALGYAHFRRHRPAEAIPHFRKSCAIRPGLAVHLHLAICYLNVGDYERALAHFETVLHLEPDHALAHFNRAVIWLAEGKSDQGWLEFEWRCAKEISRVLRSRAALGRF